MWGLTGEGGMREAQQWEVPLGMPGRCQRGLGDFGLIILHIT